jgi:hypothetical protein
MQLWNSGQASAKLTRVPAVASHLLVQLHPVYHP